MPNWSKTGARRRAVEMGSRSAPVRRCGFGHFALVQLTSGRRGAFGRRGLVRVPRESRGQVVDAGCLLVATGGSGEEPGRAVPWVVPPPCQVPVTSHNS